MLAIFCFRKSLVLKKKVDYVITNIYENFLDKLEEIMDKRKLFTKIIAGIMIALMLFSVGGTLLFYVISGLAV